MRTTPVSDVVHTARPSPVATASADPVYPGLDRYADPLDRLGYTLAYEDCRVLGVRAVSRSYGGDPRDPPSVARAYAMVSNPSRQEASTRGCLDALMAAGAEG